MIQLIIKHFPKARWPWKTYFKDENKWCQVGGNNRYKEAKDHFKIFNRDRDLRYLKALHKDLVAITKTVDSEYLVIEE